jgi:hypothetical protein
MAEAGLILINLENGDAAFVFQFFPSSVSVTDRANWMAKETTIGVKPLFYANREPRQIEFPELHLDNTDTNESLTSQIKELRALLEETEKGTPPALLACWGDRQERSVLQELAIQETFFNIDGEPIRVLIRMSLMQLQPEFGEATGVRVNE